MMTRMELLTTPPADIAEQAERVRAAQLAWERLPVRERLRPVRALRRLLATECDALCAAVARDLGKPSEETLGGDVLPLADACLFLEREAAHLLRPRRVPTAHRPLWLWGQSDAVHRRPRGVVGVIGTWNYPLLLNGVPVVQALTAGNGVLWKPSEVAPASADALFGLLGRAGFPAGLVERLPATREAGQALVEAAVDHVVFTGSAAVGRRVAARLGERLVSSTLELSGCDSLFVLEDADVNLAAKAAWFGATINRGQTCIAARRAFVHRSVYPAFSDRLREPAAAAAPVRLALASQAEQAGRLVREAVAGGGRLLAPATGRNGDPALFSPSVVLDAPPDAALCREASFAPVLAVLPFDRVEDALDLHGRCPYGLGASVFTRDPRRAEALAALLRVGMVTVNDVVVPTAHPATPFGGVGDSGWGVTQGAEGLLEMTAPQTVSVRGGSFRPHYDLAAGKSAEKQGELLRAVLESAHAPTAGRRWRGWRRLIAALWRGL
jgi:acyl-CoA reductase-like NAD-dependent aldehyde dehydrogenase